MNKNETHRSKSPENSVNKASDLAIGAEEGKKNKKVTTSKKNVIKDPYADIKKEDLIKKIKFFEEQIQKEKEEKRKAIENKNKEIQDKEKVIFSIAGTNKKLVSELEELKKEVDEKLDKVGVKDFKDTEREREIKRRRAPLEQMIKVKEKELKNAMNLIDVFRKDKENLEKDLHERGNFDQFLALQDKLKQEESKNEELGQEKNILNKVRNEHNKCLNTKREEEKEKAQILKEIKSIKEENKEMKLKLKSKINETPVDKTNEGLRGRAGQDVSKIKVNNNSSNNNASTLPNITTHNPNTLNNHDQALNDVNSSQDLNRYWKMLDSADKKKKQELSHREARKFALSLQSKNFRNKLDENDTTNFQNNNQKLRPKNISLKLFDPEEKEIIAKLIPSNQIEKLERKFESVDESKLAIERKYLTETKSLQKKALELEGRLEMTSLNLKETDQKNKILQFQLNEHKNEHKILTKKLAELNGKYKEMNGKLKEKMEENSKLVAQFEDLEKELEETKIRRSDEGETNQENEEDHEEQEELEEEENEEDVQEDNDEDDD